MSACTLLIRMSYTFSQHINEPTQCFSHVLDLVLTRGIEMQDLTICTVPIIACVTVIGAHSTLSYCTLMKWHFPQVEDLRRQQEAERKNQEVSHSQEMESLKQQYETSVEGVWWCTDTQH